MTAHWLPNAYLWSQTVIVVIGLWALGSPENVESLDLVCINFRIKSQIIIFTLQLVIANGVTIALDSITIGVSWHSGILKLYSLFYSCKKLCAIFLKLLILMVYFHLQLRESYLLCLFFKFQIIFIFFFN